MTYGFQVVLFLALAIYLIALVAVRGLLPATAKQPAQAEA
jgi:hypothetical protein